MTAAQQALQAYDFLYKNPRTGEYVIDGDEAQVAYDLAQALRQLMTEQRISEHDDAILRAAMVGEN